MKTIIIQLLKRLLGALAKDAIRIVTEVALSDATNAQKRKAAVAQLKAAAKAKQIELKDSVINLAIELVVTKLK